ncbi:thymidylate synthase (FAD) [Caldanaerobius fijiensis DSM 17918]|uniref:FAD-dependent thymidylate synthase n=1 Tax=Caldanaerobius fijiensis DSM 17918 TaxID=1121256 RepID=A0A1M5BXY8_9THEO|nr:FAD-dependent thymidylate synthase [Caldanaerobius fijiensis]SHF47423.1 thymidylate synthase (FAD) [Caldanaerobius fijiensis DSM 17918]
MEVKLLTATPDFLKVIWVAARTCKSHKTPYELWQEEPLEADMLRLARNIINSGHLSILEHCTMTFAVSGVSRALLAQYTRHRIGVSISVQSQRAVSESSQKNKGIFEYIMPDSIKDNEDAKQVFENEIKRIQECYDALKAMGIKNEDARFILPNAASTNFVTTLNLRSLMDVYQKRVVVPGAQWEIKQMLKRMAELVVQREPWLSEFFKDEG